MDRLRHSGSRTGSEGAARVEEHGGGHGSQHAGQADSTVSTAGKPAGGGEDADGDGIFRSAYPDDGATAGKPAQYPT
eukprot:3081762-Pyramimonas_sp.AAC.1